ncbi:TRAFAC clade GTPase domain-containing protein [Chryseobacterium arthrosphaerae]|uniref:TRAFAC clade GTPase domain-containing protein n=1 Tax=Chryseobacterium arthrosphaerae TaxID=651561 RepID=UPI001F4A3E9E|nr:hypothetical protein [Chryseobacterium arthrosphaerae]
MAGKCTNPDCAAPLACHEGKKNIAECEFWIGSEKVKTEIVSKNSTLKKTKRAVLPWSGDALGIEEIGKVSYRNSPIIFGLIGKANAGKTTYLAMLYTLFLRGGKLKDFKFCGTKTIKAWDELYERLKVQKEKVAFPDPTPVQYLRLLHLALRNESKRLKDLFFADASGEVFSMWSQNKDDENAENARWVYKYANAFILFIDCKDLIKRKTLSKTELIDIAQMLNHDLKDRPVIAVWSKSDEKNNVNPKIREKLTEELKELFENYEELDISNFSIDDPDILVHENNLSVLNKLLHRTLNVDKSDLAVEEIDNKPDFFLNYKTN